MQKVALRPRNALYRRRWMSPLGSMTAIADDRLLRLLDYGDRRGLDPLLLQIGTTTDVKSHPVLDAVVAELVDYFAGKRTHFETPIEPLSGSEFERRAWRALVEIPFGQTRSYGEQACAMEMDSTAARAVGLANGRNFLAIVIPCHRVIGADGSMTGYGGGIQRKKWLIEHERMIAMTRGN